MTANHKKRSLDGLAVLAKAGDDEALRLIYSESREMLRSKANLYFMAGADRDDVLQEGMIGLLSAIRTFDPGAGASFKTFSELCVKRRIINAIKMAGRQKHRPLNESVSIEASALEHGSDHDSGENASIKNSLRAPETTDPEEIVLLADLFAYVESNAPALFSNMEREVWNAYAQGLNASQIAARLGMSLKSVDNALTRIKGKIEKLVSMY
ncbi:MAG: sigma-70 family RNA polymerase sigma factor [Clostridiales Family XIII bacterium]|jgi:RNA polymerase sporulation-specific sigma factor|nr:sigma-70 family RNA polymerase sigma factor [Clostridiales Family XIII bacterium]